jgi:hypothetical protein
MLNNLVCANFENNNNELLERPCGSSESYRKSPEGRRDKSLEKQNNYEPNLKGYRESPEKREDYEDFHEPKERYDNSSENYYESEDYCKSSKKCGEGRNDNNSLKDCYESKSKGHCGSSKDFYESKFRRKLFEKKRHDQKDNKLPKEQENGPKDCCEFFEKCYESQKKIRGLSREQRKAFDEEYLKLLNGYYGAKIGRMKRRENDIKTKLKEKENSLDEYRKSVYAWLTAFSGAGALLLLICFLFR